MMYIARDNLHPKCNPEQPQLLGRALRIPVQRIKHGHQRDDRWI